MITVRGLELRAGARLLLSSLDFTVSPGDRIALIGRNGSGKTTLLNALAGLTEPAAGSIRRVGAVGFLAQDSRAADPAVSVTDRILSARGLDRALRSVREAEAALADAGGANDTPQLDRAMAAYARAQAAFERGGGYGAQAEAGRVAAGLGLPERTFDQPVGALSGGQRRRVELARILFAGHDGVLLLDEPTNHLDVDSVAWLRGFLRSHRGGLVLVCHDLAMVADVANRIFHIDATSGTVEIHNTGWQTSVERRAADERRRARERSNAERKAAALYQQADRMKWRSATAVSARSMARRADRMLAQLDPVRRSEKLARITLPEPAPCGRIPLGAVGLTKSFGEHLVLDGVDLAVERGSRLVVLGLNGAGKTTLLRILAGVSDPDTGRVVPGHGLRLGYFAQEHDTLDAKLTVRENLQAAAPRLDDGAVRGVLGAFLFTGDDADKPAAVLSGGEKTRLALAGLVHSRANVLLLDEPTNNLDPASRAEVLGAVDAYPGAIVMVTHDPGALDALHPDRVLILPEADEDLWREDYRDLVELA